MYIPVSKPYLTEEEMNNITSALSEGGISGLCGDFIDRFENGFAGYCDSSYGISTSSGTTALHLALASTGIGSDDEVLVSTFTNMATIFAILYQGAKPVPIDIEKDTLNINPALIEEKITDKTRAIMVVHIYGHPVDMDPVIDIAEKHGLYIIEDCAEAHGALYKGKKVGSLGDAGCFSFYANKIITTGEGGMVTTDNPDIANKARSLKNLAFGADEKFMHADIGFNYRMTNLQAAIGCAQLEKIDEIIKRKRAIADYYNQNLKGISGLEFPVEKEYALNVYWMYHVVLTKEFGLSRNSLMNKLKKRGIECRKSFIPCNMQKIFINRGWFQGDECPVANYVAENGFYVPSGPVLDEKDLEYVVNAIKDIQREAG